MSTQNQPNGFLVGFDLEDYSDGAHLNIIAGIKSKFNTNTIENARRVLDTTWIIKAISTSSKDLYNEIEEIINKYIGTGVFYLTVWKINFKNYWLDMRTLDSKWFKTKFGLQ